jgi:hypothetical protein
MLEEEVKDSITTPNLDVDLNLNQLGNPETE